MRSLLGRAALMLGGAVAAGAAWAGPLPSAAQDPAAAVCRPVLMADDKPAGAGMAFLLEQPRPSAVPLVVTALHLFGRAGGLARDIPAADMPARARLDTCLAQNGAVWRGAPAMAIEDAAPIGPPFRDMAAFAPRPDGLAGASVLHIAGQAPAIGDDVWVVAAMGGDGVLRRHRARVVHSASDALQYIFGDPTLSIQATSGAPVVNADGDVVGLHLGGGKDGADLLGTAVSTIRLRDLAASAH